MKGKLAIIIAIPFIMLLIFGICWVTVPSITLGRKITPDSFYSSWMDSIEDEARLGDIVIPGSHDAGTNGMMPQARTQGNDIIDQLKSGVRYFDLRVTDKGDDLVIFHGPIKGQKFSKVLLDFNTFMRDNPKEMIIMDYQHLGAKHEPIIKMLKESLSNARPIDINKFPNPANMTLGEIRANNYNLMVVWSSKNEGEIAEADANGFYIRDNSLISEYNGEKHKEGNQALIEEFNKYYAKHEDDKLFVLQAQRTAKTLLGRPGDYEKSFDKHINKFLTDLKENKDYLAKTNIIMRDYITSNIKKINLILELNLEKNLVKDNLIESFKAKLGI